MTWREYITYIGELRQVEDEPWMAGAARWPQPWIWYDLDLSACEDGPLETASAQRQNRR